MIKWDGPSISVNPLIGYGTIEETSVSTPDSKFGIALESDLQIDSIFSAFPFLNGIHVHIGSQGIALEQLSLGINRVLKCISNLPEQCRNKVNWVDIGGGVSVDYSHSELAFSFSDVFSQLEWGIPNWGSPFGDCLLYTSDAADE